MDTPEKSRLSQPLPRRRHRSHHHRCHRSLDATVILSGPPPRHPPLRCAQRNQPAPPSGAAAPTYHRSARAATPRNLAARSRRCSGQLLADHERRTTSGAAAPTQSQTAPSGTRRPDRQACHPSGPRLPPKQGRAVAPPHGAAPRITFRGRRLDAHQPSGAAAPASTKPDVGENQTHQAQANSPKQRPQEGNDEDAAVARFGTSGA